MFDQVRRRSPLFTAALLAAAGIALAVHPHPVAAQPKGPQPAWIGAWQAAPQLGTGSFTDRTYREIVHPTLSGDQVRVRLTNAFGTDGLPIGRVTAGIRSSGAALADEHPVTFGGAASVIVPAGAEELSDPVALRVTEGQDLAISVYVPGTVSAPTRHGTANTTSYYTAGDHADETAATAYTSTTTSWYLLDGVDVRTVPAARAVVALGDSITDGAYATLDANSNYPDDLAVRLRGRHISVLNAGIGGNRVATDAGTSGVGVQSRFARDVLAQSGVRTVIFLEGINDIGHNTGPVSGTAVTAADLIAGMTNLIRQAHERGLRIVGGTILPFKGAGYYTDDGEAKRQAVNAWIRTSGAFDGVVDFDAALRDPADPSRYLPVYDHGDHLHPNDAGYQAMANAIDLRLLS
jgi:lysophospholipase L1-like esterase